MPEQTGGINFGEGNNVEVTGNVIGTTPATFKVFIEEELEQVAVYKDGKLVGTCESYELDTILRFLEVEYTEI